MALHIQLNLEMYIIELEEKSDYGKLSNRKPDDLRSGTRDLVIGDKEDALDFALWKKDETEGASWKSPWGMGRPGWHIECSVMSKKYLEIILISTVVDATLSSLIMKMKLLNLSLQMVAAMQTSGCILDF